MTEPSVRLPPLNALRVFYLVVRHRSFRGAADELRVSPQAVSQQIKLLEDWLGLPLFERRGRAIEANAQAILLAHHVQAGFDELAEGIRRVHKTGARNRINLNVSPYFATRYLLDRLSRFRDLTPDSDLRLTTMVELPDFVVDDIDVAIQWGFGRWKGLDSTLLIRDYKEIACTPALARHLTTPQDLLAQPLLHPVLAQDLWGTILAHLGAVGQTTGNDMQVDDAATMRRATLAGLGVGLLSSIDAEEDLKLGRLVAPFGRNPMKGMDEDRIPGFYLVLPKAHRRVKSIAALCNWVQAEDWSHKRDRIN